MESAKVGILNQVKNEKEIVIPKKHFPVIKTKYSTDIAQYELISPIGGVDDISYLYLALYIPTNEFVALKYTDLTISIDYELIRELKNTIINTHLLKHPNILPYYTDFIENDRLWTVTYPMKAGACSTILKDYFQDGFSEMMTSTILKEVLKAVQYLHNNNLIHNNIRASNILLDFNGDVKLTGYHQLSSLIVNGRLKKSIFTPIGDNHEWAAPEIIAQNTSHNQKSDIYSIGITALELVYNKTPFDEWPSAKILLSKIMYAIPMIKSNKKLSKNFWNFVSACVRKDPKERPNVSDLLEMPFIKKAKNTKYIESILKKSGIINKHTAAIESVMQNMSEITEKARQAKILENEKTQEYNEELKRKQLEWIFSDDYSFNIDDLEISPEDQEQMNMELEYDKENNNNDDVNNNNCEEEIQWREMRTQTQSTQTIKLDNSITMSINNTNTNTSININNNSNNSRMQNSNSIIYQTPQSQIQQLSQSPIPSQILQNQQLVYTNPNSRSIPNSKSQTSSLKYVSSHSLVKQAHTSGSISSTLSSQQISKPTNNKVMNPSHSNSIVNVETRNKMNNSKSNSIILPSKSENESRSKLIRMNSRHSSVSVISNSQLTSKHNSQKIVGSEVYEICKDINFISTSSVKDKNSSYNIINDNSVKHLIKEEDEDEIKALNDDDNIHHQISQPNILGKKRKLFY